MLGALGVWAGIDRADAIVGFGIGIAVLGILVTTIRTVLRRLLDGVDDGVIEQMTRTAAAVPGVEGVDRIRARWSGHRMESDAIIRVHPGLTVGEAHAIADRVEHELLHSTASLESSVVHLHPTIRPGDDEAEARLHELTGHHASAEARRAYLACVGSEAPPTPADQERA